MSILHVLKCIVVLSLGLLIAGCNTSDKKEVSEISQPQISQTFTSKDCAIFDINSTELQCGYLEVPNDYFDKTTTYSLPIVIKRAKDSSKNLAPIIFVAGGPGGSAVNRYKGIFNRFDYEERDVILYDQRGTGYAKPFLESKEFDDSFDEIVKKVLEENNISIRDDNFSQSDYALYFEEDIKNIYDNLIQDLTQKHQSPKYFSTKNSSYDIESLRQALNYNKIILLGVSYGTRLSLEYMSHFSKNLESLILDSVISKNQDYHSDDITNNKDSIEQLLKLCKNDSQCSNAYPDLKNEFLYIVNYLNENPYYFVVENQDKVLDGALLAYNLARLLNSEGNYGITPLMIHKMSEGLKVGDYTYLESIIDIFYIKNFSSKEYFSNLMQAFINSNDYPYIINNVLYAYESLGEYAPVYKKFHVYSNYTESISYSYPDMFIKNEYDNNVKTLMLSGTIDNATPIRYAYDVEKRLNNVTHIIFENRSHDQTGHDCGRLTVKAFIQNRDDFIAPQCVNDVYNIDFYVP